MQKKSFFMKIAVFKLQNVLRRIILYGPVNELTADKIGLRRKPLPFGGWLNSIERNISDFLLNWHVFDVFDWFEKNERESNDCEAVSYLEKAEKIGSDDPQQAFVAWFSQNCLFWKK
jgi:hypothetical protein